MNKLWILRPRDSWKPWYDKAFGFVVCAASEMAARELASANAGNEGALAWLDSLQSSCTTLEPCAEAYVVICDFKYA